jgi:hypothetical protein
MGVPKAEDIAALVHAVRGERVMLDADLAGLYGVSTKVLNQAVKRSTMRSQIVTASRRNVGAAPYAFTEQGVAMLSSVLRSPRAVEVNIAIMRTFVQLRRLMDSNRQLARKFRS